jgi:ATP-dependent DNA helicase PIF1
MIKIGMTASLLDGGRTSHNRFQLPIPILDNSTSSITPNSESAHLLRSASIIVWDEATTAHKFSFQCVDRLLKDLAVNPEDKQRSFGGKIFLLCGDFRQTLPVVKKGRAIDIIQACIKRSYLWPFFPNQIQIDPKYASNAKRDRI